MYLITKKLYISTKAHSVLGRGGGGGGGGRVSYGFFYVLRLCIGIGAMASKVLVLAMYTAYNSSFIKCRHSLFSGRGGGVVK